MSKVGELVTAKESIQDGVVPGATGIIEEYNPGSNRFVVRFGPGIVAVLDITENQFAEKFDFGKPVAPSENPW